MLMVCAFFSCSDNDEPVNLTITPVVPDATLSLAVQTDGRVKTKGGFIADGAAVGKITWDFQVKNLTLVVFNNGGGAYSDSNVPVGSVAAVATQNYSGEKITDAPIIEQADLASGSAFLLLLANLPTDKINELATSSNSANPAERKSIKEVLQMTTDLSIENSGNGLSMSSALIPVTIVPGINYVGFGPTGRIDPADGIGVGTEIHGPTPVELVRRVAAINLEGIILPENPDAKKPEYKSVRFKLDSAFVANVKSTAGLGTWGEDVKFIEQAPVFDNGVSNYLAPEDFANLTGSLKTGISTGDNTMLYDLKFSQNISATQGEGENGTTLAWKNENNAVVPPCYVYPNQDGQTGVDGKKNYTLLVLKGDYTYSINNEEKTEYDRYYAVIVNDTSLGGTVDSNDESKENVHIERNTKYTITLQILGSGSATPFDPPAFAHVAAQVKVADWNVIEIDQPVD